MNLKSISVLFVSSILSVSVSSAQNLKFQSLGIQENSFFKNLSSQKISSEINSNDLITLFGLNSDNKFELVRSTIDELGIKHDNYRQFYKNIQVGEDLIMIHSKNGIIQSMNGKFINVGYVNTQVNINDTKAIDIAKEVLNIVNVERNFAPELRIIKSTISNSPELAYVLRIDGFNSDYEFLMKKVYLNAQTGAVLDIEELLYHGDKNVNAHTYLYGQKNITVNDDGNGTYKLLDSARNIVTMRVSGVVPSFNSASLFPNALNITSTDSNWNKRPAIIRTRLTTTNSTILTNTTNNYHPFGMVGYKPTPSSTVSRLTWPTLTTSTNLPLTARGYYTFVDSGVDYYGVYGRYRTTNGSTSDTFSFPITDFTSGNHDWNDSMGNSGIYTIDSIYNPAIDAHWGMEMTHDYFMNRFNRNSFNGNGTLVRNFIDGVFPLSRTQQNASAMQAPYNCMVFGLGDGFQTNPFVALDVMAHEFTHLVTSTNGNGGLRYQKESGALNESFSDIFGTSVDFYANDTNANWLIGEDVYVGPNFMRSMAEPKLAQNPDTYKGQYWLNTENTSVDNGGVHYNSGVPNKWYYLLCMGGTGTNDNGYNYTVNAIGIEKAEKIAYRTLMQYLTYEATFQDAYNGSLQSVIDLYGADTTQAEYVAVKNAWWAVGLGEGSINGISKSNTQNSNIQIYPNPSTNNNINVISTLNTNVETTIINSIGQVITKIILKPGNNVINTSNWSKGTYNITFIEDGKQFTHKVSVF